MILLKEKATEEDIDAEERVSETGSRHNQGDRSNLHCTRCKNNGSHEAKDYRVPWDNIKEDRWNKKEVKFKPLELEKINPLEYSHYIVAYCNIGVT